MSSPASHVPARPVSAFPPSLTTNRNTVASAAPLALPGIRVCHLTPIQAARDERAFSRESVSALPYGLRPTIVGPHSMSGSLDGVEFVSAPPIRSRVWRILSAFRLLRWALPQRADIWHAHNPEMLPAALLLKWLFRKKVVYDSREDFPAMMLTKTYLSPRWRKFMSKFVATAERFAARQLDGVVTADPGTLRPLARTGNSQKLVLYNFPNLDVFTPKPVEKTFDVVYRGGLSERAGTFVLLRAVRYLLDSGFSPRVLLFGYVDNEASQLALQAVISELRIEHLITLAGRIPYSEMAATLSSARILVCPLQQIPKFMNNIPVKVFEAWACGVPVIASDLPPIRPFIRNRPYGLLFKPDDAVELATKIRGLLDSPALLEQYGTQAREAVLCRYNNSGEARKLISFYNRVLTC